MKQNTETSCQKFSTNKLLDKEEKKSHYAGLLVDQLDLKKENFASNVSYIDLQVDQPDLKKEIGLYVTVCKNNLREEFYNTVC